MTRLNAFATKRPLLFVLAAIVAWMLLGGIFAGLTAGILQVDFMRDLAQSVGMLLATLCVVLIAGRLSWLRAAGIARPGRWIVWLLALIAGVWLVCAYLYGFFGEIRLDLAVLSRSAAARAVLPRQLVVGPVEEIMFRGIVLYVLARRWGGTAGGLLASLVVASLLFGSLHMLQAFAGASLTLAAITTLNSALSGFWWGALVLRGRSVWPAVLLHILSNSIVQIQALGTPGFEMTVSNTMTATLLELPLAVIAVIVLLRWPPRSVVLETPGA